MFAEFFRHPEFVAASAALISAPIIIHLINRLRFKRIRWAAMEFLLKAQKKNRRKLIIEQLLLLALRCLLVALVGLLVARFVGVSFADYGVKQSIHIVLIDDSLSMTDRWKKGIGYTNCFEQARDEVLIKKIADKMRQSSTPEQLIVLPLSAAVSESLLNKKDEKLSADDAQDREFGANGGRMKTYSVHLDEKSSYYVRFSSETIPAYLRVLDPSDRVVAEDVDAKQGSQSAGLAFTAGLSGRHKIVVAGVDARTGIFQLDVFKETPPKRYELSDSSNGFAQLKKDMAELEPTRMHLNLLDGVKRARKLADENPKALITFTLLSDFRKQDWDNESGALHKELVEFARQRKAAIHLIDTLVDPGRTAGGAVPPAHDNVGIVELRPRSRMVGRNMPVTFTLSVANYGPETEVNVSIYELSTGERRKEVSSNFMPALPLKLKRGQITQANFELQFNQEIPDNESYFAAICARLEGVQGSLDKDGLLADNEAFGVVEVRKQVPVLIIDGEGERGDMDPKKEGARGGDSYFLRHALTSVGAQDEEMMEGGMEAVRPFRVDLPYEMKELAGKLDAMSALEELDLRKYPTIILCNVPQLNKKQLDNLERYVADGGGLAIYMGPLCSTRFYNEKMFRKGTGLFPAELKDSYYPAPGQKPLETPFIQGVPMVQVRDEDPTGRLRQIPIFSSLFTLPGQREWLQMLPIHRYFQVAARPWDEKEKGERKPHRVQELATLANDTPIEKYSTDVMDIVRKTTEPGPAKLGKLLERSRYTKYAAAFAPYRARLQALVEFSQKSPYFLAVELERMLKDRGTGKGDSVSLEEFWKVPDDPDVTELRKEVEALHYKIRYSDASPFILSSTFGKGKVITVMSTAGNLWTGWPGGNLGSTIFSPFVWEMQNFLSAQGTEINRTLGQNLVVKVDAETLDPSRPLTAFRSRLKPVDEKPYDKVVVDKERAFKATDGTVSFSDTREPGVYLAEVLHGGRSFMTVASVFNVDTQREGNLERVDSKILKANVLDKGDKRIDFSGTDIASGELVKESRDLSESTLLFLLMLAILVAEQALAVHLSFHLKSNENLVPAGQARRAAAA